MKTPIVKPAAPAVYGSDTAPIIYFEGVVAWGNRGGVAQIELGCNHIIPMAAGGEAKIRTVVTAHLRCSAGALEDLMQTIEKMQTTPPPLPQTAQ